MLCSIHFTAAEINPDLVLRTIHVAVTKALRYRGVMRKDVS